MDKSDSSSEEELDFDDWSDDEGSSSKRRRVEAPMGHSRPNPLGNRKVNNIWGDLVVGEVLSTEVSGVLLTKKNADEQVERASESYDVSLKSQLPSKNLTSEQLLNKEMLEFRTNAVISKTTGRDIVEYGDPIVDVTSESNRIGDGSHTERKRRRPPKSQKSSHSKPMGSVKDRLGFKMPDKREAVLHSQIECLELSPSDDPTELCEKIAQSLREEKSHLIRSICDVIGVPKTIELYKQTVDIENGGGMLTLKGDRRKTPGGVFIQLVKEDPTVNKVQIDKIFEQDRKEWRAKQTGKRRFKQTSMGLSNEQLSELKEKKEVFLNEVVQNNETKVGSATAPDEMEDGEIPDDTQTNLAFNHADLISHRTVKAIMNCSITRWTNS